MLQLKASGYNNHFIESMESREIESINKYFAETKPNQPYKGKYSNKIHYLVIFAKVKVKHHKNPQPQHNAI